MKFTEFINERYVNTFKDDVETRNKYKQEVYDLIQEAYKEIGGFKGRGFNSPDDLVKNIDMWKLKIRDGKVIAGKMYKDRSGRKSVCTFTNGSSEGVEELKKMIEADAKRSYSEVSSKLLWFIVKTFGESFVKKYAISVEDVKKLLVDDEIRTDNVDEKYLEKYPTLKKFFYTRELGGSFETKIAFGTPNLKITR